MSMTFREYQKLAARTINTNLKDEQILLHALHEMAGEVGEIHSLFQKVYQGHALNDEDLCLEVGDLLWGIAELCTARGWDMGVVAERNILKLKRRYPEGFSEERSLHREV